MNFDVSAYFSKLIEKVIESVIVKVIIAAGIICIAAGLAWTQKAHQPIVMSAPQGPLIVAVNGGTSMLHWGGDSYYIKWINCEWNVDDPAIIENGTALLECYSNRAVKGNLSIGVGDFNDQWKVNVTRRAHGAFDGTMTQNK